MVDPKVEAGAPVVCVYLEVYWWIDPISDSLFCNEKVPRLAIGPMPKDQLLFIAFHPAVPCCDQVVPVKLLPGLGSNVKYAEATRTVIRFQHPPLG